MTLKTRMPTTIRKIESFFRSCMCLIIRLVRKIYRHKNTFALFLILFMVPVFTMILHRDITSVNRRISEVEANIQAYKDSIYNQSLEAKAILLGDSVYNYIQEVGIKNPSIVYKQALLESDGFQSHLFKRANNMFGMRNAYSRPSTSIGSSNGYAVYNTWQESVLDYALYQTHILKGRKMTDEEYIAFISKSYAEDSAYMSKILTMPLEK